MEANIYKIAFLIRRAWNSRISATHLVKILYAAELRWIARKQERFTNFEFIHDRYGPNIPEIREFLDSHPQFSGDLSGEVIYYRTELSQKEINSQLPSEEITALEEVREVTFERKTS